MKIFGNLKFSIYIYPNDHPPPHCHIRFKSGHDVSVDIPLITPRYGATISKEVEEIIQENLEELCNTWEKLNQPKKLNKKTK